MKNKYGVIIIKKYIIAIIVIILLTIGAIVVFNSVKPKEQQMISENKNSTLNNQNVLSNDQNQTISNQNLFTHKEEREPNTPIKTEGEFIDLAALDTETVVLEVYNMQMTPQNYVGKRIKLHGPYYDYYNEEGKRYQVVIFVDAEGCCTFEIELKWNGAFPKNGEQVEVLGVFGYTREMINEFIHFDQLHLEVETLTIL